MMSRKQTCPECGADCPEDQTCQDYFHQMLYWEAEYPDFGAQVHHLMVLCYHLQHPGLYSPVGLDYARQLLVEFLENGAVPEKIRMRDLAVVDSNRRKWKVTGSGDARGSYAHPMRWPVTVTDVVAGGVDNYCNNVHLLAKSIHDTLTAD